MSNKQRVYNGDFLRIVAGRDTNKKTELHCQQQQN